MATKLTQAQKERRIAQAIREKHAYTLANPEKVVHPRVWKPEESDSQDWDVQSQEPSWITPDGRILTLRQK